MEHLRRLISLRTNGWVPNGGRSFSAQEDEEISNAYTHFTVMPKGYLTYLSKRWGRVPSALGHRHTQLRIIQNLHDVEAAYHSAAAPSNCAEEALDAMLNDASDQED